MYTALKALEKIFKYVEGTKIFMNYIDYILDYYSNNRFGWFVYKVVIIISFHIIIYNKINYINLIKVCKNIIYIINNI